MKKNSIKLLLLFFITILKVNAFSQPPITNIVTEANFSAMGWEKSQTNGLLPEPETARLTTNFIFIVCGPVNRGQPQLKRGSVYFTLPTSIEDPSLPKGTSELKDATLNKIRLRNSSFDGSKITDIAELKYSTYTIKPSNKVAPRLILQIALLGPGIIAGQPLRSIIFDPSNQRHKDINGVTSGQEVELDKWQEWDALAGWWTLFDPKTDDPTELKGSFTLATFATLMTAKIINSDPVSNPVMGGGGIRITVPNLKDKSYENFRGYIDAFKIKIANNSVDQPTTLYDFMTTEVCKDEQVSIFKRKYIYFIISGLAIWGCFIVFRNYRINQQRKNIK
jgi:hypothetical protein